MKNKKQDKTPLRGSKNPYVRLVGAIEHQRGLVKEIIKVADKVWGAFDTGKGNPDQIMLDFFKNNQVGLEMLLCNIMGKECKAGLDILKDKKLANRLTKID